MIFKVIFAEFLHEARNVSHLVRSPYL